MAQGPVSTRPTMPTLLDSPAAYAADSGARPLPGRYRAWIYGALMLLTLAVILADRRATPTQSPAHRTAVAGAPAPAGTPDDRPLLLPDR